MLTEKHFYRKRWTIIVQLLVVLALGLPLPGYAGRAFAGVQPLLWTLAMEQPTTTVSVIVQKTAAATGVEEAVTQLGGVVTKDLHIINAFAAEVNANAIPRLAQIAGVRWISWDAPVQSAAATSKFTTWATKSGTAVANGFTNVANMLNMVGKDRVYSSGGRVKGAFVGFLPEYTPGLAITKLEVRLELYVSQTLANTEVIKVTPYVGGKATKSFSIGAATLNAYQGAANAGTLYVDVSTARAWTWADFKTLEIVVDQSGLGTQTLVYHDALGVRVSASAGTDTTTPLVTSSSTDTTGVNTSVLTNVFQQATRAVNIWNESPYWQGAGMTIAVVDSGSYRTNAIGSRLIGEVNFNSTEHTTNDQYGHGTFVTGLIADDGTYSGGKYMGMAPKANILGLRVSDDAGMSYESDVVLALQWLYTNKTTYNIKVANLSLNSSLWQSYNTSPLCAAVEILWFNGITVVVSAGNNGTANLYPPANDPFVITVGSIDDQNTVALTDDAVSSFSAYGIDETGQVKPDLVAPGRNIIAYLPDTNQLSISVQHPENRVDSNYFRMSGTSMAAPMVSGAAAIVLQANPNLTPDQVKYRLKATANSSWPGYTNNRAGAGYLDVYAATKGTTTQSANTGLQASQLLWTGSEPITWGSVSWNSVSWNSVSWNSVSWNSVSWNSVSWNSDYWDSAAVPAVTTAQGPVQSIVTEGIAAGDVSPDIPAEPNPDPATQTHTLFLPVVQQ